MIAAQPKQAEFDQKTPILAVGVDNGHGLLKVALDADSRQMKVRCPSRGKGSEAATKCHAITQILEQQAIQLKFLRKYNLPVNDD